MSSGKAEGTAGGDRAARRSWSGSGVVPLEVTEGTRGVGAGDGEGSASVGALWSRIRDLVADAAHDATMHTDLAAEAHAHYCERFTRLDAGVTWGRAFIGRIRRAR